MEAIKKQASKLREQVAKQQQAVLRQLKHLGNETANVDESGLQCRQQLQSLYSSTRAAKHFQKNIVRAVESYISINLKQMEIVRKLAEDCCKYGSEYQDSNFLARAALHFGSFHNTMESERSALLGILKDQVSKPLREMIFGAPLEDARHLTHRYEKLCQEVESQEAEVLRRRSKSRDSAFSAESSVRLQAAEERLTELKSTMMVLGREATGAMTSVEDQQQKVTFQRILIMVDSERSYHRNVLAILEKLQNEMIVEEQLNKSSVQAVAEPSVLYASTSQKDFKSASSKDLGHVNKQDIYFIAKVVHPFEAQMEGELSLSVDDYVVVRQVAPNGWSEGECNGSAGWFPSAYVVRQKKAPAGKISEASMPT